MSLLCPWTLEIENNIFSIFELQMIGLKMISECKYLELYKYMGK